MYPDNRTDVTTKPYNEPRIERTLQSDQLERRQAIEKEVEAWLAKGNEITKLPSGIHDTNYKPVNVNSGGYSFG